MSPIRELDVRAIPPPRRHPEIFGLFDGLEPDEAFVLVNDHDPKPLLYQFQAERPAAFDWSVLEGGPERFRVEIRRRSADGPRTVTDCLEADHRRLDAIIPVVRRLVEAGSFDTARSGFAEFVCGLNRHIDIEEQLLFPIFEEKMGLFGGGPTVVMKHEHVQIRDSIGSVVAALESSDTPAVEAAIDDLVDTLSVHNGKEEGILYPMTDRALGSERARDDLVKHMQAF